MTRTDTSFPSGTDACAAWLYRPNADDAPTPVIVMGHGLAGVKEMRLDAFAERFVDAGYTCLVFDYRHFGASTGEPRRLLDIDKQLEDWSAAVAYARSLDGIDPDRVVVWGTSFGGGHSIITAARDKRVAAAIAQCPFTNGIASATAIPPRSSLKVTALAVRDIVGALLRRPPVMVPSYGPPGSTALMATPDAVDGITALIPDGMDIPGDVAARFGLDIIRHFPGRSMRDIDCPTFLAICDRDTVAPAKATSRHAKDLRHGEVKHYDAGHFDIYIGEWFEKNITDQLDFLARNVPVERPA